MAPNTVMVTGANGFLGSAVARAFSQSGWKTYGLVRKQASVSSLLKDEIIPVLGSAADPSAFVDTLPHLDVIVSTTEDITNYAQHFNETVSLLQLLTQRSPPSSSLSSSNAQNQAKRHLKPLVIFTSGCKDYGTTALASSPDLQPHTESSPLNPPPLIAARTLHSVTIFDHAASTGTYDVILTRPTTLYGHSGTYYAPLFALAESAAAATTVVPAHNNSDGNSRHRPSLMLPARAQSITHGTHVDDVAAAYVALANMDPSVRRRVVEGKVYNISAQKYDTAEEVGWAVAGSYGVEVRFEDDREDDGDGQEGLDEGKENGAVRMDGKKGVDMLRVLMDFSQWVDSTKVREVTGWRDRRIGFVEGFEVYRGAYEVYKEDGDERSVKMKAMNEGFKGIDGGT